MKLSGWPPPIGEFIGDGNKIINLAPFSPKLGDRRLGNLYEIRTYTMQPGGVGIVTEAWAEKIAGREKFSPLAFCGATEIAGLNQWIHVWAYKDAAERFSGRDAARASGPAAQHPRPVHPAGKHAGGPRRLARRCISFVKRRPFIRCYEQRVRGPFASPSKPRRRAQRAPGSSTPETQRH